MFCCLYWKGLKICVTSENFEWSLELVHGFMHRISIPAYAIEQQWSKNDMSLMTLIFKNDARSLQACHYVALFQEFVDTPVNSRPSLFHIDSVH
jgi:hypothetical protein